MRWETNGMRLAREEGEEEGLKKGVKEGKEEVAAKLLAMGLDPSVILKATGLSETELAALKESDSAQVRE